jgi:glycosyltransferase involved in cell wall biosynthesis
MKRDLIVFGEDWGRHPSSTQHIIRRLAADRKIVWINSVGMRRPRLNISDAKRVFEKIGKRSSSVQRPKRKVSVPDNMKVIEPKVLPLPGSQIAAVINRKIGARKINDQIKAANLNNPAIWVSVPTAVDLLPALPQAPVAYYCGDDFGGLDGVDHEPVLKCETTLAQIAQKIFTVSPELAKKFDKSKVVDLPHGADIEMFAKPAERAVDLPLGNKVAGFYGSISAWLDQDLMRQVAISKPDWTFVFIGDIRCDVTKLSHLRNVRLLGARPHDQLPRYAQHWTVSMLPFVDNAQIRACNPLKLREYMATGTPIISTPFPALEPYSPWINIESSATGFQSALEFARIESANPERRASRANAVAGETWEARAQQAAAVIDAL